MDMQLKGSICTHVVRVDNTMFRREVNIHGEVEWKRYLPEEAKYRYASPGTAHELEEAFKSEFDAL